MITNILLCYPFPFRFTLIDVFERSVPVVSTLHAAVSEATQERDALLGVLYEFQIGDNETLLFSLMMGSVAFSGFYSISHGVAEKK